ncbi:SlyX family protein [Aquamicrobium zhengzhouense]|uniref:Protein SlyX homolog n=1 Tax=Aquamicrobium zhengzhouense TaxID=2781738 RepID=A0ABS0SCE9_9HYPH|nr:SlyX family protein [Aquamicrobium zhengzhouense]MBI1620973.1 SlyX family protein [Aquamicrobium zhengzhouense]
MTEERIVQLEILVAEQERTIAELSNELAEQWKVVNVLERKLNALINRFLELEEQSAPEVPITQPPHW